MLKKYSSLLQTLFFLLLGIICIYLAFRSHSINEIRNAFTQVRYVWYIPVLIATLICHFSRAMRWQILLRQQNIHISFWETYHALMSAYIVNFATGKLGEIYRCAIISKRNKQPFSATLVSVIAERVIDVFTLFALFIFSFFLFNNEVTLFSKTYIYPIIYKLSNIPYLVYVFPILFICLLFITYYFWKQLVHYVQQHFTAWYDALKRLWILKEKPAFFIYTILIWLMYLCMTYFWFFGFTDAKLNIATALLVIVLGGVGRSLPVPAHGLGTYHICAAFALRSCGVNEVDCIAIPLIVHAGQTLFYLVFGTLSLFWTGLWNISFNVK